MSPQLTGIKVRTIGTGYVSVTLGKVERWFSMSFMAESGRVCASGGTADLVDAVRSIDFWRGGQTSLRELVRNFPFLNAIRLALALEEGDPVADRWDMLLGDEELTRIRPLLQGVRKDGRLGWMFPSVTHLTLLRLSATVERSPNEIRIALLGDGSYRVDFSAEGQVYIEATVPQVIERVVGSLDNFPRSM